MSGLEVVYTVHKFVAENVDEISFNIGEKVFIIEKDDGYNDGWWRGRNERGETGLFPISYTVSTPPVNILEDEINRMRTSTESRASKHNSSLSSKNIQSIVKQSLNNPALKLKPIEEWNSKQVSIWLTEIGFDQHLAKTFKDQEITGDILLELTLDSLKELQIDTFGKRFKIHSAITALKNGSKNPPPTTRTVVPELNRKQSVIYYSNSAYSDDDLTSNYSTATRNSQLPSHEPRGSINLQMLPSPPSITRKTSQLSTTSTYRWHQSQSMLPEKSNQPDRRHTLNTNLQDNNGKYNFMRSSLLHPTTKLQSFLPSSNNMIRRSEDIPLHHENSLIPEMEGWLYKQGDRYKNWNKRWFVLKGSNLFYFKSPKAIRMKGIINLKGYRVEVDGSIQTGKYCFKVHHEKERIFYFYTDQEKYMKDWIKALMKATIERDYSKPVMSSSTVPTISLEAARRNQPRPPSTLFEEQRNRTYREGLAPMKEHPEEHVFQQSLSSPIPSISRAPSIVHSLDNNSGFSLEHRRRFKDSGFNSVPSRSLTQSSGDFYPTEEDEDLIDPENRSIMSKREPVQRQKKKSYVDWVNLHIRYQIHDLSELSTGEILLELLENLSGKEIKQYPVNQNQSVHSQMMDRMITAFEHMHQEGICLTGGYTFRDVLNGREVKIMALLDDIRAWSCTLEQDI